jgi:hypothetical protein
MFIIMCSLCFLRIEIVHIHQHCSFVSLMKFFTSPIDSKLLTPPLHLINVNQQIFIIKKWCMAYAGIEQLRIETGNLRIFIVNK